MTAVLLYFLKSLSGTDVENISVKDILTLTAGEKFSLRNSEICHIKLKCNYLKT